MVVFVSHLAFLLTRRFRLVTGKVAVFWKKSDFFFVKGKNQIWLLFTP
jgi:hypothetical protein